MHMKMSLFQVKIEKLHDHKDTKEHGGTDLRSPVSLDSLKTL